MDQAERMKQAFAFLIDTSFGTLWWAANDLWKQNANFILKPEQEGKSHPGVSLRQENASDRFIVPLLLGRSEKYSASQAIGLKMDDRSEKKGYFGTLKPVRMSYMNFLDGSIRSNQVKPKLGVDEKKQLYDFVERRLSWFTK